MTTDESPSLSCPPLRPDAITLLGRADRLRSTSAAAGHLLYLLRTGRVVVPVTRSADGWECVVVAKPHGPAINERLMVANLEIETAAGLSWHHPLYGPDAGPYLITWTLRVHEKWPGSSICALAVALTDIAAERQPPVVALTRERVTTLLQLLHLSNTAELDSLLNQLMQARFLLPADGPDPAHPASYALALPPETASGA